MLAECGQDICPQLTQRHPRCHHQHHISNIIITGIIMSIVFILGIIITTIFAVVLVGRSEGAGSDLGALDPGMRTQILTHAIHEGSGRFFGLWLKFSLASSYGPLGREHALCVLDAYQRCPVPGSKQLSSFVVGRRCVGDCLSLQRRCIWVAALAKQLCRRARSLCMLFLAHPTTAA